MRRNYPAIARRWEALGTSSEESPNPKIQSLPRVPANKRDYGMLHPSAKARHAYSSPASEQESMNEGTGVAAHFASRPGKMSLFSGKPTGFALRDTNAARRRKV
jgi:hypothetical protein